MKPNYAEAVSITTKKAKPKEIKHLASTSQLMNGKQCPTPRPLYSASHPWPTTSSLLSLSAPSPSLVHGLTSVFLASHPVLPARASTLHEWTGSSKWSFNCPLCLLRKHMIN